MSKSSIFTIVACIVEAEGKVLLLKRHPHKSQGGLWALPAGKIDVGETYESAMIRELYEETGLSANKMQLTFIDQFEFNLNSPDHYAIVLYALKTHKNNLIVLNDVEHTEYRWVRYENIASMPGTIADIETLVSFAQPHN